MKIGIISHSQKQTDKPERYVSKNAAAGLVRRLLAVRVSQYLIQMVEIRHMTRALPAVPQKRRFPLPKPYEHHIEPRLERLGIADSDWMAYINGCRRSLHSGI